MRLIAVREIHYAGANRYPGDEFDAPDLHAKILIMQNAVREAPKKMQTAAIKAEEPEHERAATSSPRRYKRRDMRAEK